MVLQTRVFWREVAVGDLNVAIDAVRSEVNAFLATLAVGRIRAVDTVISPSRKYGEGNVYATIVVFLEE